MMACVQSTLGERNNDMRVKVKPSIASRIKVRAMRIKSDEAAATRAARELLARFLLKDPSVDVTDVHEAIALMRETRADVSVNIAGAQTEARLKRRGARR